VSHKGTPGTKVKKAFLTLAVLALLAVALQSLVFSSASFTATKGNPGNAFTAGTLTHVNSRSGAFVVNAADLRPGQSSQGTLTITGGGDFSGSFTLSKASVVDVPAAPGLSNALTLRIEDTTGTATTLFNGTVAAFTTVSLGSIAPGVTRQYRFTLTFPAASAAPGLQGASMSLGLLFKGVTP
jgi:spore coat-associated protein N